MTTERHTTTRRIAAALIAVVGVIHLVLAPEYLSEEAYIGVLFIAGGPTALLVAGRLWMADGSRAWSLGALVGFIGMAMTALRSWTSATAPAGSRRTAAARGVPRTNIG
jgi:hypothetical protein